MIDGTKILRILLVAIMVCVFVGACAVITINPAPSVVVITSAAPTSEPVATEVPQANTAAAPTEATPGKWYPCGTGMQPSYLHVGMYAVVTNMPQMYNRLRAGPTYFSSENIVASIAPGAKMKILDGPWCDTKATVIYWNVRIIDKNMVKTFAGDRSILNSVYTAESDSGGDLYLTPSN